MNLGRVNAAGRVLRPNVGECDHCHRSSDGLHVLLKQILKRLARILLGSDYCGNRSASRVISWLVLAFVVNTVSTVIVYTISYRRRADCSFWLKCALLWGPLAIPFVLFARPGGRITV